MTCSLSNLFSGNMTHTLCVWQNLALGSLLMEMDMQIHQWLCCCSVPWGCQVSNACTCNKSSPANRVCRGWNVRDHSTFRGLCSPLYFSLPSDIKPQKKGLLWIDIWLTGMAQSSPCQSATPPHLYWFWVCVARGPQNQSIATLQNGIPEAFTGQ